jgi:uncharacterized membrane protein (UPF0127 family)
MPLKKKRMIILICAVTVLFVLAFGAGWYFFFGRANAALSRTSVSIGSATFSVEVASTFAEQARGLSYRTSLGENAGMLFTFSSSTVQSFWMKDMHFPLDMIWISGDTVDGFAQNVPAPASGTALWSLPIYASPDHTDKVLEVNAGMVAKYNIKVGDSVKIKVIE